MAWIYSPESVDLRRPWKVTFDQSPTVKTIDSLRPFFCQECIQDYFRLPLSGTIYERSRAPCSQCDPTSSMVVSPARTFPLQDAEKAWTESAAAYFLRSLGSSASYDPPSSSWKTFQRLLFEDRSESLASFASSGMTVAGVFYPLEMWARTTDESDGGLWRTPDANMERGQRSRENLQSRIDRGMPFNLNDQLNAVSKGMWPTPQASDYKHPGLPRRGTDSTSAHSLAAKVSWPTPRASEWKGCGPKGSKSQKYMLEKGYLSAAVTEQTGGSLNPTWVEWLMGYPSEWTVLEDWATQWFRSKRARRSSGSSDSKKPK